LSAEKAINTDRDRFLRGCKDCRKENESGKYGGKVKSNHQSANSSLPAMSRFESKIQRAQPVELIAATGIRGSSDAMRLSEMVAKLVPAVEGHGATSLGAKEARRSMLLHVSTSLANTAEGGYAAGRTYKVLTGRLRGCCVGWRRSYWDWDVGIDRSRDHADSLKNCHWK
jgi:hypothetical protein